MECLRHADCPMGAALSVLPVRGRPIGETGPPQKTVGCIDQHRKVCIVQRNPTSANCIERGELGACCVRQRHAQAGNQHQSPEQPSGSILPPASVETEMCGHYAGARCHHFENSLIWTADTALLSPRSWCTHWPRSNQARSSTSRARCGGGNRRRAGRTPCRKIRPPPWCTDTRWHARDAQPA
jgi:hypothetical protein